jgi:hypothetical protein
METKEMIELIQQHHPHIGEVEAIKLLNRSMEEFCERTDIYKKTDNSITTVADQRWYSVPSGLLKIEEVYFDDVKISRLQGNPIINDES